MNSRHIRPTLALALLGAAFAFASRPGDQLPILKINPAYNYEAIRPAGYAFPIGAMDFMSNGDLVVSTWTDTYRVMIVKNATGTKTGMSVTEFASGLSEILGLKVVDDQIYILQKDELTLIRDTDHDGKADDFKAVAYNWTKSTMEKEYAMGLVWDGRYFYSSYGDNTLNGGTAVDPVPPGRLNGILRISLDGTVEPFAGGVRVPGGLEYAFGEIWLTENQGGFRPANPLFNIRPQRWYGRPVNPPSMFQPVGYQQYADKGPHQPLFSPAAVWMPYKEAGGRSPGNPLLVKEGPYKNQFFVGDADSYYGGMSRVFLEKVNGEYQGATFHFSQGFDNKLVYRSLYGPDGFIYCGANGSSNSLWTRTSPQPGLGRLKPSGVTPFDMLAVRSTGANSFEFEFTKPLAAKLGNDLKGNLQVNKYWERPQELYGGGDKLDLTALTVGSAAVSSDRRKVAVTLSNVTTDWTYYFHWTGDALEDETGAKLWGTEAWYTLNNIGPGSDPVTSVADEIKPGFSRPFALDRGAAGELRVQTTLPRNVPYVARLADLRGRLQAEHAGRGSETFSLAARAIGSQMVVFTLKAGDRSFSQMLSR